MELLILRMPGTAGCLACLLVSLAAPARAYAHEPDALVPLGTASAAVALFGAALAVVSLRRRTRPPGWTRTVLVAALIAVALLIGFWILVAPVTYLLFLG